jgi:hypothetical protein
VQWTRSDAADSNPGLTLIKHARHYKVTPFGNVLFEHVTDQMGINAPELRERLERIAAEEKS